MQATQREEIEFPAKARRLCGPFLHLPAERGMTGVQFPGRGGLRLDGGERGELRAPRGRERGSEGLLQSALAAVGGAARARGWEREEGPPSPCKHATNVKVLLQEMLRSEEQLQLKQAEKGGGREGIPDFCSGPPKHECACLFQVGGRENIQQRNVYPCGLIRGETGEGDHSTELCMQPLFGAIPRR